MVARNSRSLGRYLGRPTEDVELVTRDRVLHTDGVLLKPAQEPRGDDTPGSTGPRKSLALSASVVKGFDSSSNPLNI